MKIGILGIQGDVDLHRKKLEEAGLDWCIVKKAHELEGIDGFILPGGESTTISKMLERYNMNKVLKEKIVDGLPVLATCAGTVLLASRIEDGEEEISPLGILSIKIKRNAYGRQRESFEVPLKINLGGREEKIVGVFIRAPKIVEFWNGVDVLGTFEESPVMVKQGKIIAMTFHPELSDGVAVYKFFEEIIKGSV